MCPLRYAAGQPQHKEVPEMLTMEKVQATLRSGRKLNGRLLTCQDGSEWLRVSLRGLKQLRYYQGLVTCYGFVPE